MSPLIRDIVRCEHPTTGRLLTQRLRAEIGIESRSPRDVAIAREIDRGRVIRSVAAKRRHLDGIEGRDGITAGRREVRERIEQQQPRDAIGKSERKVCGNSGRDGMRDEHGARDVQRIQEDAQILNERVN